MCALTDWTVGAVPADAWAISTLLSLSLNVVVAWVAERAQPSGTLTVNPPAGGR
ncbi:hypothetical protein ACFQ10_11630 [Streptomyces indonesiensis]